eukprot:14443671-Alexandrium_andersonii.AAC.1
MSASLVGSEMCIRDRARAGPTLRTARAARKSTASTSTCGRARTRSWTSVSYTHLTLPTICSV